MNTTRIKQIELAVFLSFLALLPVALVTEFPNPFITTKLIFAVLSLGLVYILKGIRNIIQGGSGVSFHTTLFDVPVLLLAGAYVASAFTTTPNKMDAFWSPGTAAFIVIGALAYFAVTQLSERAKELTTFALIAGGSILAFVNLLVLTGIFKGMQSLPGFMRSDSFTPIGSVLSLVIFLVAILPLSLHLVIRTKDVLVKAIAGVASVVCVLALLTGFVTLTRGWKDAQLPTLQSSWVVATETLKEKPLFGAGPGNYLSAYSRFVPLSNNRTEQWSVRYATARNFYLTVITETGLFGFAALVILMFAVYKKARTGMKDTNLLSHVPFIVIAVALAFFPATPTLMVLLFVILAIPVNGHVIRLFHNSEHPTLEGKVANIIISAPVILGVIVASFLTLKAGYGEMIYQNAIDAIAKQEGKNAYETLRKAIQISPYSDRYHVSYAQLNLALANAIAQKKELTAEERTTIGQLIQQSIREARVAVVLNRQRASNWETLASIYRAVMPLAKGADQFAVQTYAQTIALDPTNPNTRLALGSIYYGLKRYEEAIDIYKLAVVAKPDLANARYNLAIAYRDNGQYDRSLAELSQALTLVKQGSKDYDIVKKEIENVQSKAPKKDQPKSGDDIKAPETATDSAKLNPPIDIPEDAKPPASDE